MSDYQKNRYWFTCPACGWEGIRHCSVYKCPKCPHKPLVKGRPATKEECEAALQKAIAQHKQVPE